MSQQEQSTSQADVEAMNNAREAHIAALNNGDVEAWVAAFTDDGVQMPPMLRPTTAAKASGLGRKPS